MAQPENAKSVMKPTLRHSRFNEAIHKGKPDLRPTCWLIAVNTGRKLLVEAQGRLAIKGDALRVMQDVDKMRARDPILKDITSEIALILAPQGGDLRAAHVWSEENEICDQPSRLKPGVTDRVNGPGRS